MAKNRAGFLFEDDIRKSGKYYGMHTNKIPSPMFGVGLYDFILVWKSTVIAIECKATLNETSFPFSRVPEWQVEALIDMDKAGGKAYLLINIGRGRSKKAYILPILKYCRMREIYNSTGRKSIPIGDLTKLPQLERDKESSVWDIRILFTEEIYNETMETTSSGASPTTNNHSSTDKVRNNKKPKDKDV